MRVEGEGAHEQGERGRIDRASGGRANSGEAHARLLSKPGNIPA